MCGVLRSLGRAVVDHDVPELWCVWARTESIAMLKRSSALCAGMRTVTCMSRMVT